MIKQGMTISEAAHEWVREMNGYPQEMISVLMQAKPDDWHEVTMPRICSRVYVFNLPDGCDDYDSNGEIENIVGDVYLINLDDGNTVELGIDDFEVERDSVLPMWGWMWSFSESADDYWMEELDGIKKMSECGFRVYEHEEWGYFFGIDGCGYSFYEEHWVPAYKARGLKWHDKRTEHSEDDIRKMLAPANLPENIVEKLLKMYPGKAENFGGRFGGYLKAEQIQTIKETGHYTVTEKHEKVLEMHGYEDHDYVTVKREV